MNMVCLQEYSQKDLAVATVSKNDMKGMLNREVPNVLAISSKLRVSLCEIVLNGGSPNGGNPSSISPELNILTAVTFIH
jgi:hypothetical protein